MIHRILKVLVLSLVIANSTSVFAYPIIRLKVPGADSKSFIGYSNGELKTIDAAGNFTLSPTSLDFDGTLATVADLSSAFYSLEGVRGVGLANVTGNSISQNTQGGTIRIYADQAQTNLVLQGTLGTGSISGNLGVNNSPVKYESWTLNVTGGSILSKLEVPMLDLQLNYQVSNCLIFSKRCFLSSTPNPTLNLANGVLDAFQAKFIDGISQGKVLPNPTPPTPSAPVPEPATMSLLGLGALAGIRRKYKLGK